MNKMYITITTSRPKPDQVMMLEAFLEKYLPRLEKLPGVKAIYHYMRPEQGDDATLIIWESPQALEDYRKGALAQEAMAFEKELGLAASREGYPLSYATSPLDKMGA